MRACFLLKVRPEKMDEYKARHAQVWPEMLDALRESGWRNYSLFLRPDGVVVGYVEADDFEKCRAAMKTTPSTRAGRQKWRPFSSPPTATAPTTHVPPRRGLSPRLISPCCTLAPSRIMPCLAQTAISYAQTVLIPNHETS